MADVAAITGDSSYIKAIDKIWDNIVSKKIYITGGIGAHHAGEAFGNNYELPNLSAYCETCAAIGNVYMNYRLFLLHGDAKYFDVLERTLYNGLISGVSLDGGSFFYPNPLSSNGKYSRKPWFGCACCPSNVITGICVCREERSGIREPLSFQQSRAKGRQEKDSAGTRNRLSLEWRHPPENNAGQSGLHHETPYPRLGTRQCTSR